MLDKKNCYIILERCFNKGCLIKLGPLHFKQFSANQSRCLPQLHYAHSVTSRGPKEILYMLVVDENGYYLLLIKGVTDQTAGDESQADN